MMMPIVADAALVARLGWTLIHFLWQGALIGLVTASLLMSLRAARPQSRYLVACAGLLAMLIAPVVTFAVLRQQVAAASASADPNATTRVTFVADGSVARVAREAIDANGTRSTVVASASASETPFQSRFSGLLRRLRESSRRGLTAIDAALPWLVQVWTFGICALSLRLAGGLALIARMRRRSLQFAPADLQQQVSSLAHRVGIARGITLRISQWVDTPAAIGCLRPVVLLPASALSGLAPDQLEAVLAHELAHIRRHDYLVNLFQSIAETLLFYHPAVWYVSHQIRVEREHCCDDEAVAQCGDATTYASALAELELLRHGTPTLAMTAIGNRAALLRRVRRLLSPSPTTPPAWSTSVSLLAMTLLALVIAATHSSLSAAPQPQPQQQTPRPARVRTTVGTAAPAVAVSPVVAASPAVATTPIAASPTPSPSPEIATTPVVAADVDQTATPTPSPSPTPTPVADAPATTFVSDDDQPPVPPVPPAPPAPAAAPTQPAPPAPPAPGAAVGVPPTPPAPARATTPRAMPGMPPTPPRPVLAAPTAPAPPTPPAAVTSVGRPGVPPAPPAPATTVVGRPAMPPVPPTPPTATARPARAVSGAAVWVSTPAPAAAVQPPAPAAPAAPARPARAVSGTAVWASTPAPSAIQPLPPPPPAPAAPAVAPARPGVRVRPAQPEPPEPPEPPVPDDNTFLPGGPPDGVASGVPGGVQGGVQGGVRDGVSGTVTRRSERSESTFTMVSTDDNNKLSIRGRGRIEFTDDDADVKSLTPGGYLDIEQTTRDGTVRVEFQAQPNGAIQRRWWKNGHEAGFEPEGRAWLKSHLVEILRRSGLDAEARVDRLLRMNGPQAVLAEVSLCPSDYVKRVYLTWLLSAQHLDPLTLTSLLTQVNREIKSNYDRRVVLVAVTVHRMPNDDARLTYVDATRGMRSDYDRRVTLEALLKAERLAPPVLRAVLASTMEMHSAYDGRTVLERIVETQQLPGDLRQLYIDAADKLRSDYDRSRALSALSRNETAAG